jgi:hypothetical protein
MQFIHFILKNFKNFIKASYSGLQSPMLLNYNSFGVISLQLPQGSQLDSYFIYLSVNIIDDFDGKTTFQLPSPIQVVTNNTKSNIFDTILSSNGESLNIQTLNELKSGNLNLISKNAIVLSNALNRQSLSYLFSDDQNALIREYIMDKLSSLSVSDTSSIKVLSTALSSLTQIPNQISANLAVEALFHRNFLIHRKTPI